MPDPYAASRPALKTEILATVAKGTPLRTVCARPGMPSDATVWNWRNADATFAQMLGQAVRESAWRRRWMFDPVRAEAFLARYRAGERMVDVLKDPAMPSRRVLEYWCGADQFFAEQVHRLRLLHQSNRLRRLNDGRASRAAWDPKAADRVLVALVRGRRLESFRGVEPDLPGRGVIARWRKEQPEFDAEVRAALHHGRKRDGAARRRCAALKGTVVERILRGESLRSLAKAPDMPTHETLYRWIREQPDFAEAVGKACEHREDWYRDQMVMALDELGPTTQRAIQTRLAPWSRRLGQLKRRPGRRRRTAVET